MLAKVAYKEKEILMVISDVIIIQMSTKLASKKIRKTPQGPVSLGSVPQLRLHFVQSFFRSWSQVPSAKVKDHDQTAKQKWAKNHAFYTQAEQSSDDGQACQIRVSTTEN